MRDRPLPFLHLFLGKIGIRRGIDLLKTGSEKNLWYRYDSAGNAISVTYESKIYMYICNVQNDVIALIDNK